jgi:hypothetical protein
MRRTVPGRMSQTRSAHSGVYSAMCSTSAVKAVAAATCVWVQVSPSAPVSIASTVKRPSSATSALAVSNGTARCSPTSQTSGFRVAGSRR